MLHRYIVHSYILYEYVPKKTVSDAHRPSEASVSHLSNGLHVHVCRNSCMARTTVHQVIHAWVSRPRGQRPAPPLEPPLGLMRSAAAAKTPRHRLHSACHPGDPGVGPAVEPGVESRAGSRESGRESRGEPRGGGSRRSVRWRAEIGWGDRRDEVGKPGVERRK